MRGPRGPPTAIWLMAGTDRLAPRGASDEGVDGEESWSLADSAMSHGDARAAPAPRHRSRSLIASTGEGVVNSSMSAMSGVPRTGSGSKTEDPIASAATHDDHAPARRTDISKQKLRGAAVNALNDGTRCTARDRGIHSGTSISRSARVLGLSTAPEAQTPAGIRHAGGTASRSARESRP